MNILKLKFSKPLFFFLLVSGLVTSCSSCGNGGKKEEDKEDIQDGPDTTGSVLNINGELFSVPSPIQTALLIQKSGIAYDKSILNQPNKVNTFSTDYSRAFNLGIYGADLGYVSLYNQTQDALGYLASIKQLSDKLGISAAFDVATMERIKNNITNKDSMMVLVGLAYRASDAYLKNNQRNDISSLVLAGGWLESMHFSAAAYKSKPSESLRARIAEQKQALGSLIKILASISSPEADEVGTALSDLAKVYEGVQLKYNYVEPVTDSTKKLTYLNSTTEAVISEEQITQILGKVEEIRNKIVNTSK